VVLVSHHSRAEGEQGISVPAVQFAEGIGISRAQISDQLLVGPRV
jgi:hypothetical protein